VDADAAADHPRGAAVLDDLVVPHPLRRAAAGRRLRLPPRAPLSPGAQEPAAPGAAGPAGARQRRPGPRLRAPAIPGPPPGGRPRRRSARTSPASCTTTWGRRSPRW
jgi:hypothetical protein